MILSVKTKNYIFSKFRFLKFYVIVYDQRMEPWKVLVDFTVDDWLFFKKGHIKTCTSLTYLFPMHPFSTPENMRKPLGFFMFSGGRERAYWEQMC